ncbi:hypothetical protein CALCODRAFT_459752 [Calocera cornea HHB12733]|uniref:DUF1917-domain-containing protein n=1 Tax=Calocera cornea HHB12733 TaxID=1353952 RepID=A0A165D3B7_9BASI|nr:hypothetical protein CALCODRAFT_459752 [Calocera cornea HHB12733]
MDSEVDAPQEYVYSWTSKHELPLEQFLSKYKPSMVQDDGTKPWIWVRRDGGGPAKVDLDEGVQEGATILEEATDKVAAINNDDNIPTRSNKKTGARSKKELREEVQAKVTADLKKLSQEKGMTTGKWLFFAQPESIDGMWTRIAKSLVEGDLARTPAWLAKVSTSKATDERAQHLICLYLPDLYDKAAATEVLKVLVGKVGLTPGSAKTDLYTHLGLDSKHPSGIRSTVWQIKELLSEDEIKKLKDDHTAAQSASKSAKPNAAAKRADPFGDDEASETAALPKKVPMKRKDEFEDDEEEEKRTKKAKTSEPPSKKPAAKKQDNSETEYEDGDEDAGADLVRKPGKKALVAAANVGAAQKPGASRLGKVKALKTKYD